VSKHVCIIVLVSSCLNNVTADVSFRWMRARDNRQAIAERHEIITLRTEYVRTIKYHQEVRPKMYIDEHMYTVSRSSTYGSTAGVKAHV
jgi:hypothetical protein